MLYKNKRASIFVYVLILINVSLIIGYVVFNNTYILNNNINIWKNAEEVFLKLSDKWNINIESVRQYNANGDWFTDFISCPQNITMSGSTKIETSINSEMQYDKWTTYCTFKYDGEEVRLYFDDLTNNFTTVYYDGELKDVINKAFSTGSLITNTDVQAASPAVSASVHEDKSIDGNYNNQYKSKKDWYTQITFDLQTELKIWRLKVFKKANASSNYWSNGYIYFMDSWNNIVKSKTVSWVRLETLLDINLAYASFADADEVRYIKIMSDHANAFLNVSEIEVYELNDTWIKEWVSDWTFNDWDDTLMTFDETWIGWDDFIDDNMNSDNYRSTSSWVVWYPWDFADDDIVPRLTIFWSIQPSTTDYFNVFWNNYKTEELIENNSFNNDDPLLIATLWEVTEWYMFFDLFSRADDLDYDFKIIVFDKNRYKDEFTLYPTEIYDTLNIDDNYWYLQYDFTTNIFSLSEYKTGNEFVFDFKNKDYALFFNNHVDKNLALRITWEEKPTSWDINDYWRRIYINAIDDSKPGTIETIANHVIIWWEKNFIWENFKVIWSK